MNNKLWPAVYSVVPELVDGCQMSCALCWNSKRHGSMENMSIETIKEIIKKHGHVLSCWYNWGEPLLHKQFAEASTLISATAMSFISTNLSLYLSDEYLNSLLKYTRVYVSLSGITKDIYAIYNKDGNFDLVFYNLDRLIQTKINNNSSTSIILRFERHKFNEHQYETILNFCKTKNILFEPIYLNCEVEDLMIGFDHDLLRKPVFNSSVNACGLLNEFPIGVDGTYLLCCASHNVKTTLTVYDDVSMEDVLAARKKLSICEECRELNLFKAFY